MKVLPERDEETGKYLVGRMQAAGYVLVLLVISGAYTLTPTDGDAQDLITKDQLEQHERQHTRQHDDLTQEIDRRCERITDHLAHIADAVGKLESRINSTLATMDAGTSAHREAARQLAALQAEMKDAAAIQRQYRYRGGWQ